MLWSVLFALAFEPFLWWPLALVAPVPLFLRLRSMRGPWALLGVWVGTMPFWGFVEQWIWTNDVSRIGFPFLIMIQGAWMPLFVCLSNWAMRLRPRAAMPLVIGVVWFAVEYTRAALFMGGYPWYLAAHPLIESPILVSPAVYLDDSGMGLLVAIFGATLVAVASRRWRDVAVGLGSIVVAFGVSFLFQAKPIDDTVRVGLVQTNLETTRRREWTPTDRVDDFIAFIDLSSEAIDDGAEVVIWPETMHPGDSLDRDSLETEQAARLGWRIERDGESEFIVSTLLTETLIEYQAKTDVPMVIGDDGFDGLHLEIQDDGRPERTWDGRFNSVHVVEGGEAPTVRYDKVHLTPFGEVMPVISRFDWLENALLSVGARGMRFDLDAGREANALPVRLEDDRTVRLATPICFESTIAGHCRDLATEASFFVTVTNDGWFGTFDAGRRHHVQGGRWRAVENRQWMVRSANTGVSCVIDHRGVVRTRLDPRTAGVLVADVECREAESTAIGPLVALLGAILCICPVNPRNREEPLGG